MLLRHKLWILLQGLTLFLSDPVCSAASLGLTVHVVPLESNGGSTVRAHFSAIVPTPCPSMTALCAQGEDCKVHATSLQFNGTKPSGWCVRQWQKTVPSNYSANVTLGSTEFYVSMNAQPTVRGNSGKLNYPAFVALPPPFRARVNCSHHFHLSVKDLDGDKVHCRFANSAQGECFNCSQHSFIELDGERCMLTFTGNAPAGQYHIYLMAEDRIPVPKTSHATNNNPMSAVPVHLSLTVEESTISCLKEPVVTTDSPGEDSTMIALPYQEVKFNISFSSQMESAVEVAVVGPPDLYRLNIQTAAPLTMMTLAWVRSENDLTHLLPICFAVNTMSMQSEPRCVWLYQRQMKTLPAGTELTCGETEMVLVLPLSSLSNINLTELQLNNNSCPVTSNSTHILARISLDGCGTQRVHVGSELIYTNILQSVRPYTVVSRKPSLILPLACRIPGASATGPRYQMKMPSQVEAFGSEVGVWIEIHFPGEGSLGNFTRTPVLRFRRDAESSVGNNTPIQHQNASVGSQIEVLYLHLLSNCTIDQAEMIVSQCIESESEDFSNSHPVIQQGCSSSESATEVVTTTSSSKVYRLDLSNTQTQGSMMYIQCTVNLCISMLPSEKCPNLCNSSINVRSVVGSLFTQTYTVKSGPVSRVVTTAAPSASNVTMAAVAASQSTTANAPKHVSAVAAVVIVTALGLFLQNAFLY